MTSETNKLHNEIDELTNLLKNKSLSNEKLLDLYNKIAIKYLTLKLYEKASDIYCKISKIKLDQGCNEYAAFYLEKAGIYYSNIISINTINNARHCFEESIKLYISTNNYIKAARISDMLGDILMMNNVLIYKDAYNYYHISGLIIEGIECLFKAINILIDKEKYQIASEYLLIVYSHFDVINKGKVPEILLQIGVIKFCDNVNECKMWLNTCKNYNKSKEYLFLETLINNFTLKNTGKLLLNNYTFLKNWEVKLLGIKYNQIL